METTLFLCDEDTVSRDTFPSSLSTLSLHTVYGALLYKWVYYIFRINLYSSEDFNDVYIIYNTMYLDYISLKNYRFTLLVTGHS